MKLETIKTIISMLPIAGDDETRPHISGVYLESDGKEKCVLKATNGHMAVIRECDDAMPKGQWMVFRDQIPALKLILKEAKYQSETPAIVGTHNELLIGTTTRVSVETFETDFANIEAVIPKHRFKTAITLNADYILKLAEAVRNDKRGNPIVRIVFDPTNALNAALIELEGRDDFTAIVMVCRDKGAENLASEVSKKLSLIDACESSEAVS